MAHETSTTTHTTNKRKRGNFDNDPARGAPGYNRNSVNAPANDATGEMEYGVDDSAINQLIAHNNQDAHAANGGNPASASDTAAAALSHYQMGAGDAASFPNQGSAPDTSFGLDNSPFAVDQLKDSATAQGPTQHTPPGTLNLNKPQVGSEEWHKVRRDNHKEVERRRRETINEGINELQKIVPGCEKNKGSILQRAVQYITQLKDNESQNIEKWTLEKLLLDQAINELSSSCDRLKSDYQKAWEEKEAYKRACDAAGIVPDDLKDQADASAEA